VKATDDKPKQSKQESSSLLQTVPALAKTQKNMINEELKPDEPKAKENLTSPLPQ
jgi:hypothetical protein